jgi:hypothetical protein
MSGETFVPFDQQPRLRSLPLVRLAVKRSVQGHTPIVIRISDCQRLGVSERRHFVRTFGAVERSLAVDDDFPITSAFGGSKPDDNHLVHSCLCRDWRTVRAWVVAAFNYGFVFAGHFCLLVVNPAQPGLRPHQSNEGPGQSRNKRGYQQPGLLVWTAFDKRRSSLYPRLSPSKRFSTAAKLTWTLLINSLASMDSSKAASRAARVSRSASSDRASIIEKSNTFGVAARAEDSQHA